jgi:hypothetical protein
MITSIREDINDGLLRFAFIAYFEAISFARADTAVSPYAEDLDRVASFEIHPGTKKRRMLCIVVSRLPAVFHRLMFLDYQIGLESAYGAGSGCAGRITNRAIHPIRTVHLQD